MKIDIYVSIDIDSTNVSAELPLSIISAIKPKSARFLLYFPSLFWYKILYQSGFSKKNRTHAGRDKVFATSLEGLEGRRSGKASIHFQTHCLLVESKERTRKAGKFAKYSICFLSFLMPLVVTWSHKRSVCPFLVRQ